MTDIGPRSVAEVIRANGGALPYRRLDQLGVARAQVAAALRSGDIVQVRTRWFATTDAPADVVRAVRVGGSLTAASVLKLSGIWMRRADPILHVRVPQTAGRLWSPDPTPSGAARARLDREVHGVCVHYRTEPDLLRARDPLPLALAEYARCATRLDAHIAVDSALSLGELDAKGLAELARRLGPGDRRIAEMADGGCQSGTETIVRLLLRGRRVKHRTQVSIVGVGRVDVLVGDRLVIEIDGEGFHSGLEFEADRRRDFELIQRGYLVLRLNYSMVMQDWADVQRGIVALIERGEHRWGGRSRLHERSAAASLARKIRAE